MKNFIGALKIDIRKKEKSTKLCFSCYIFSFLLVQYQSLP